MKGTAFLTDADDPVDIRIDGVFKAVFTKNTPAARGALSKFVSALIGREITIDTILSNEPPIDSTGDRQLRLDINCRAENGELVNVEMCLNPRPYEAVRMEYHATKLFAGQDIKGLDRDYEDLKQTYQIAILSKRKFIRDKNCMHVFEFYDPAHRVPLNGKIRIITLELSKVKSIAEKPINEMSNPERWAVFLEYLTDRRRRGTINKILASEEGIAMASSVLMKISRDELERARIMRAEKTELDWQSEMTYQRKKGLKEGMQQGEEKTQQYVLQLIAQGLSADDIKQKLTS